MFFARNFWFAHIRLVRCCAAPRCGVCCVQPNMKAVRMIAIAVALTVCAAAFVAGDAAAAGKKYLEENAAKEGVTTTASGLQYKVLKAGTGSVHPTRSDTVTVHYRGTLTNGKEFDSSYKRGEPTSFGVGQVIAGWTEALQLMRVGDTYELTIPSDLAYGKRGAGRDIGPNSTLIFKVELLKINGKDA